MKKLLLWLTLPLLFVGCTAELESRMDGFEDRLSKLETLCSQLNTNITSLQMMVNALQNNDYITAVTPISSGGKILGYTINFAKNQPITIYHGQDGEDGKDGKDGINGTNGRDGKDGQSPVIGVKKHTDGQYYWTINGSWLLDANGNKIKAVGSDGKDGVNGTNGKDGQNGSNGITPKLKIVDGYWYVSYDNGKSWERAGKASGEDGNNGDSFFRSVDTSDPSCVKFILADGTTISIPKSSGLDITFNFTESSLELVNGQTIEVGYTLVNATSNAKVTVSSDGTYKLKVIKTDDTSGKIAITAGDSDASGYVNVLVVDNGYSIVKVIDLSNFEVFFTLPSGYSYSIPSGGGNIAIPFETNIKRDVSIYSGDTWLSLAPETKAVEKGYINVTVKRNTGGTRTGKIKINTAITGQQLTSYLVDIVQYSSSYAVDLSEKGTANSYIVSSSGSYKFKAVKGNSSASVGNIRSVEVLWETFGTNVAPKVGDLVKSASYSSDGYIRFDCNSTYKEGNALIAAKDASGKILWSWHIWMTDQPKEQVYYNNAGTMMDRNLGATTATLGEKGVEGLVYQWGRKDPFMGGDDSGSIYQSTLSQWPEAVISTSEVGSVSYAIENPLTIIMMNNRNRDWLHTGTTSNDNTRWSSNKTIYDPCPPGWRVPDGGDNGMFYKTLNNSVENNIVHNKTATNFGVNMSGVLGDDPSINLPFGCYFSKDSNGNKLKYTRSLKRFVCHTVTPYDMADPERWLVPPVTDVHAFVVGKTEIYMRMVASRDSGYSVRCCKE